MTLAISCLIAAAALIYLTKLPVALAMAKLDGRYDNHHPRAQQARLTGFGARALAAHQNSIEAFPLFAAGLLLALWAQAPMAWVNGLCLAFVGARIAYCALYLLDVATLRSLVWALGTGCSFWLMALAL